MTRFDGDITTITATTRRARFMMWFYNHWMSCVLAPAFVCYVIVIACIILMPGSFPVMLALFVVFMALWLAFIRTHTERMVMATKIPLGRRVMFARDPHGHRATNADVMAEIRRNGEADGEQEHAEHDQAGEADL